MLYSGRLAKGQKKGSLAINTNPIIIASSSGYVLAQFVMSLKAINNIVEISIIISLSLLSLITAYFSIFIHKYFFIQKHLETIKKHNPSFGLPKKLRKDA